MSTDFDTHARIVTDHDHCPEVCGALGCTQTIDIKIVDLGDGRFRAVCYYHRKQLLGGPS